jgi:poly-gamma-glutamate synthesis protein (capsule biosynthesis protein)
MDGRLKPRRLVYCIALGLALGGVFGILIARLTPICPKIDLFDRLEIPALATSSAPIIPRGTETPEVMNARLLFVGDIMLDRNVAARSVAAKDPSYPFRKLPVDWFDSVDYSVANLEGPITDKRRAPEKTIDFQFDPSVIPVLKEQGIDAFSQANNHALDQGKLGYDDSVRRLREAGFLVFGHQVEDGSIALATSTIRNQRIAFLGFNNTDNPIDRTVAAPILADARRQSDHVIVYMHWGNEYRDKPDAANIDLAHWFIDNGVDIVIGGHPHWTQGISSYKGKPIIWSLGNFIFDQDFSTQTRRGLAVEIELGSGSTSYALRLIPIQIDLSQPRLVEGAEKVMRLEDLAKISDKELADQIRSGMIGWPGYGATTSTAKPL